jgi:uncharacterized protein YdeI (YjbR/CyaY-like superfamily)
MKTFDARTIERWRAWLDTHHASASEIWLVFHKKHTGNASVAYLDALDEALCYGWSAINRKRYAALEAEGRVKAAGKARSPESGARYDVKPMVPEKLPAGVAKALKAVPAAWGFFKTLTPREQRMYFGWIHLAKREETKQRRLAEAIRLLSKKQKLGLK